MKKNNIINSLDISKIEQNLITTTIKLPPRKKFNKREIDDYLLRLSPNFKKNKYNIKIWSFSIKLKNLITITSEVEEKLINLLGDDGTIDLIDNMVVINFEKKARSLPLAVSNAIENVINYGFEIDSLNLNLN